MNIVLKYETLFITSLPVLTFNYIFEMVPSWRELVKEKAKLVRPAADPSPATNSHCDILTLVSSRKNESVTSFSILACSDSVYKTDSHYSF